MGFSCSLLVVFDVFVSIDFLVKVIL